MHKYAIPEIERRRVAKQELLPDFSKLRWCKIQDNYIKNTRMRLRKEIHSDWKIVYKLCKKYWKTWPITEEIVNSYLSEEEYNIFLQLPSSALSKTRYFDDICDINIFEDWKITIEKEFKSEEEANSFIAPVYCWLEVSDSKDWESATIAWK